MKDKERARGTFKAYLQQPLFLLVFMVILTAAVGAVSIRAGTIVSASTIVYIGTVLWLYSSRRKGILAGLIAFSSAYDRSRQNLIEKMPTPYTVVDGSGHLFWMSRESAAILAEKKISYKNIIAMFPDITREVLATGGELVSMHNFLGGREFRIDLKQVMMDRLEAAVAGSGLEGQGSFVTAIYLVNETQALLYMQQVNDQKLVAGLIYLGNYDEALESVEEVRRSLLTILIDRRISKYISGINGIVKKLRKDKYFFVIKQQYMVRIQEGRFSILEDVKTVNISNDVAVALGIGIDMNGDSYSQNYDYTRTSIDIALRRGGDQAVVKDSGKIQYYGDKAQRMEKTARAEVRMKAYALRGLMENKDRLSIMGHRLAGADSFRIAVGICRIAVSTNKKADIVANEVISSVCPMMGRFIGNTEYLEDMFLTRSKVSEVVDRGTMLIIVDMNRPSITGGPTLLREVRTVAVLDHHKTSSEITDNAVLSYMEPYVSSTCEIVAEVLQYIASGIRVKPAEADAMYAGIVIDTQNFTDQIGVRTFETVAFLRHSGTDITGVRKLFGESVRGYQAKADAVRKVEVYMGVLAVDKCSADGPDGPIIIGAQTINELLGIRGIKASVVLTDYNGIIHFSARFIGEVSVQVMMEKLRGGGYRTIAGAQMEGVSVEDAEIRLKEVIRRMLKEGKVSWE